MFVLTNFLFSCICASTGTDVYQIFECTRPIASSLPSNSRLPSCPEHCFVVFARSGQELDSRGFFADAGSIREPTVFEGIRKCSLVRSFPHSSIQEAEKAWSSVTDVYEKYNARDYHLTARNCCSVAVESLTDIRRSGMKTLNVEKANSSIGTKCTLRTPS